MVFIKISNSLRLKKQISDPTKQELKDSFFSRKSQLKIVRNPFSCQGNSNKFLKILLNPLTPDILHHLLSAGSFV